MKRVTCGQVEELVFDFLEDALDEGEHAAIKVHLALCEECAATVKLCRGLPTAVRVAEMRPLDPVTEKRLTSPVRVVAAGQRPAPKDAIRWVALAAAVTGVLVAGFAVWMAFLADADDPATLGPGDESNPAVAQLENLDAPTLETDSQGRRVFRVAVGTSLILSPDAVATVLESRRDMVRFALKSGFALADVGPMEPGFRFIVETPGGQVEARGTVFSVSVSPQGEERVRVSEGLVEVRGYLKNRQPPLLSQGMAMVYGDAEPTVADPAEVAADLAMVFGRDTAVTGVSNGAPGRLVELARTYRRSRMFANAAQTYRQLIAQYPDSSEALDGYVALGQLELLMLGQPQEAREHFSQYLQRAPSGDLADVARGALERTTDPSQ